MNPDSVYDSHYLGVRRLLYRGPRITSVYLILSPGCEYGHVI